MKLTADNVLWFIYQYNCSVGHPTIIRRRAFEKEFTAQWHTIEPIVNQLEQIDHLIVRRHVFIYDLTEKGLAKVIEMAQYKQENVMVTKRFWMEIGRCLVGLYDRLNGVNCLLVLFSTAMAISANATTWYVSKSGNDSNTGKSEGMAFLTIQKAINEALSDDLIIVDDGVYDRISADKRLRICSRHGADKTFIVDTSSNMAASLGGDLESSYSYCEGFTISGMGFYDFTYNYGNGTIGKGVYNRCKILAADHMLAISANCVLSNSMVLGCSDQYRLPLVEGYCRRLRMYNCTVVDRGLYGISNSRSYMYDELALYNCICISAGWPMYSSACVNCLISDNSKYADPGFVDAENNDFRLMKESSCIDAGNNSYSTIDTDLAGKARIYNGTVDIGAYEYQPEVLGGISNIIANQRYPWNGKVDLSFVVTGESETAYKTSFMANDLGATANVDVRTLYASDGSHLSITNSLKPGVYKWVWDASQDLPSDFVGERMVIVGNVAEL